MNRLTYKSQFGDYGSTKEYASDRDEIMALRKRLGEYEETGLEPDEIVQIVRSDWYSETTTADSIRENVREAIKERESSQCSKS